MTINLKRIGRIGRKNGIRRELFFECKECGIEFKERKPRIFCSKNCYYKSMAGKPALKVISNEVREKRKNRMTGKNNPMWKGGDSDKERRNSEYKNWRVNVFKRDKFKCQKCGYYNGNGEIRKDLNAHHIVPWIESTELRYVVENGITMCVPCHIKEHTDKT